MIGALWNGMSGVITQSVGINVQSNNASNVNSVAHKSDTVTFEDLMYSGGIGNGVTTQSIRKNFEQGELQLTGVGLDAAIDGDGFFVVNESTTGDPYYTRAGNFTINADGTLRTQFSDFIMGTPQVISNLVSSNPAVNQFDDQHTQYISSQVINSEDFLYSVNAKSTDYTESATQTGVSGDAYRTKGNLLADIELLRANYQNALKDLSIAPNDPATSSIAQQTVIDFSGVLGSLNSSTDYLEVFVGNTKVKQPFDTDAQTTLDLFTDKLSAEAGLLASSDASGVITIDSLVPGESVTFGNPSLSGQFVSAVNTVEAIKGSGQGAVDSMRDALQAQIEVAGGEFIEITNAVSYANEAGLQLGTLQTQMDTLGLSTERFAELEINDGILFAKQDDQTFVLGSLTTVTFTDFSALNPEGNNQYSSTTGSGDPIFADGINTVIGGALELGNTSLSDDLTNILVYQRAFEASSKSITTADEFLNIAIQLKK